MTHSRTWHDIGSDVNWTEYGGRWARRIDATRYHVIRFENCAEWGDGATGYHCDLSEVDITNGQLADALESCDVPTDGLDEYGQVIPPNVYRLMLVEALSGYGAYAPLWSDSGRNAHKLVRAAKAESRRLRRDAGAYYKAMDRPVNKIGSTAREYAAGDISSAILRGLAEQDPRAELMAKIGMLQVRKLQSARST